MSFLDTHLRRSPTGARVLPFLVFVVLTFAQGHVPAPGQFWLYLAKVVVGGWLLWLARPALSELEWRFSPLAFAAGVGVFVLWVGLDPALEALGWRGSYPKLTSGGPSWNPFVAFGDGSALAWMFVVVRLAGSALLVPMLEEVFFRSFLYRYAERPDFLSVPLAGVRWRPFAISVAVFGVEHGEWLAGLLAGVVYQALVCRSGRIGEAVTAHAVTNFLLGLWVVTRGQWQFW